MNFTHFSKPYIGSHFVIPTKLYNYLNFKTKWEKIWYIIEYRLVSLHSVSHINSTMFGLDTLQFSTETLNQSRYCQLVNTKICAILLAILIASFVIRQVRYLAVNTGIISSHNSVMSTSINTDSKKFDQV